MSQPKRVPLHATPDALRLARSDDAPLLVAWRLSGARVVVVGAGAVARRKLGAVLRAGASEVDVIAPGPDDFEAWLREASERARVRWVRRAFEPARDLAPRPALVVVATDDPLVNARALGAAEACGVPCLQAGAGPRGALDTLAKARPQGALQHAVASQGHAPALSRLAREGLDAGTGPEWGVLAAWVAMLRPHLHHHIDSAPARAAAWRSAVRSGALDALREATPTRALDRVLGALGLSADAAQRAALLEAIPRPSGAPVWVLSGFGPFPGVPHNPTPDLARAAQTRLAALAPNLDVRVVALPTRFDLAWQTLQNTLDPLRDQLAGVLALGVASRRSQIELERIGANRRRPGSPDAAGRVIAPAEAAVLPGGPQGLQARLPIDDLVAQAQRAGHPVAASESAGRYLCNAVLYRLMAWCCGLDRPIPAGFVHVPMIPETLAMDTAADTLAALVRDAWAWSRGPIRTAPEG